MIVEIVEAWLLAAVIVTGLAIGALGLLLLGWILSREWITPLDDELQPAALTIPLAALLWLPAPFFLPLLYPWAVGPASPAVRGWFEPVPFLVRLTTYLLLWSMLALFVAGRGESRRRSIVGLALLVPTAVLAGLDWVLGREPYWWSGLAGFAFATSQLAPALGLAFLANALQHEHMERLHDRSLVSALLTLALATVWLWFVQFLAAWMGNLPDAAAWYEARLTGGRWITLAVAAAMLAAAVLLLLQRHRGDFTVVAAAGLIVSQHLLLTVWLLRPVGTPGLNVVDLAVLATVGGAWLLAWAILMRRRDRRAGQSGRWGSSKRGRSGGTSGGQTIASSDRRL